MITFVLEKILGRWGWALAKAAAALVVLASFLTVWRFLPNNNLLISQQAYAQVTTYSSPGSGTYTCPSNVSYIIVKLWGAGGGGAYGGGKQKQGNGGGGGGAYSTSTINSPSLSYPYTVGLGGASGSTQAGGSGQSSTFGTTLIVAKGGLGGSYVSGGGGAGGAGGSGSTGDTTYTGGSGGTGALTYSGGGGGGAGSTGNGGNASGSTAGTGTSANGGDGGAGRTTNSTAGAPGSNYGGGGSSGAGGIVGGSGANGLVMITAYVLPTVTTSEPSNVSYTTATLNGNVTDAGYPSTITRRGFCYKVGTSGDCTTSDSVVYEDGSFSTGTYTRGLSGLSAETGYRVRAYAVNSTGTSYGTTLQLTTLALTAPTVTTSSPSNISYTTATLNGEITSIGGSNPTRRGFCYKVGTSGDCTTADNVIYEDGDFSEGTYSRGLSGLSSGTSYRIRAYAVNSVGTGYGDTMQLTTLNYSPTTALNSPPDLDSTTNATPTFNFTATDAESNPVEYNIQIDTSTSFNSQGGSPLLNKVSTTDSGFTSGHPYSSGSAAEFTVQSGDALSLGTYYWRVRAIDPTGSNTYGDWATYRTLTITSAGIDLSGIIYQSSNESLAYDCSGGNTRTVLVKVNGSGSSSATCDQNTGAWSVTGVPVSSGGTVYAYISGVSVAGSTIMISNGSAQTNIPIIVNRVVLRDDVNGSITNTEIEAGDTSDAEDLVSFSGLNMTVGSSYETHIYTGDTFAPDGNVTTGKLHVVGNYSSSTETLTLTGSGSGTSRPLYVDGGTFTIPSTIQFQGTSDTDINALTYTNLVLNPTIASGVTYTFLGAASANGNFTINPNSTGSNSLSVNLGGEMTVATTKITTIQGTDSGIGVLNTTSSNYTLRSGKLDIPSGGILTANASNIYLNATTDTLFSKTGTFNEGTSRVFFQPASGSPTLTSGTITFYNMIVDMAGQTGAVGGNTTVGGNDLSIEAGTLSIPSTHSLSVTGYTTIAGSLTISSTGDQTLGSIHIFDGGTFTRSSASGINTLTGSLIIDEGGTFSTSNNPSFTLQDGISNDGTFSSGSGTYTFDSNNQSIGGGEVTGFSGNVIISGAITVDTLNTNTYVFIGGDLIGSETGSTYKTNSNTQTYFWGAVLATGTLNAASGSVTYKGSSAQTVKSTTYQYLYIQPSSNGITTSIGTGTLTATHLTIGNGSNTGVTIEATSNDPDISVKGEVIVANGTTFTNSDSTSATLNIDGNLTINTGGTFTAPKGTNDNSFTLAGNLTNNGTFNHNDGQVTLDSTGTSQLSYSSATTFYQFSVLSASAGKTVQFDETDPTIIANDITIQGSSCSSKIYLKSLVSESPWEINIKTGASQNIDYIDLEDADGTLSEETPTADSSTQTGINAGWTVTEGICTVGSMVNFEGINMSGVNVN